MEPLPIRQTTAQGQRSPFVCKRVFKPPSEDHVNNRGTKPPNILCNTVSDLLSLARFLVNAATLAHQFVQEYRTGDRNIEGGDFTHHRY